MNLIFPKNIRPTTNKLKEAIFNILYSEIGTDYSKLIFADFFAGSGQIGIQAIQRKFRKVIFIEKSKLNIKTIEENLKRNKISEENFLLINKDSFSRQLAKDLQAFKENLGVMFLDPPYKLEKEPIFALLSNLQLSKTIIILEREYKKKEEIFWSEEQKTFFLKKKKKYGSSILLFLSLGCKNF